MCKDCGKKISKHALRCKQCSDIQHSYRMSGSNNSNYKGGKPKCLDCGQELLWTHIRCKKCYHLFAKGKNHSRYGKKHSKETKIKMKLNHADFSGKNHPMYGKKFPAISRGMMGRKNINYGKSPKHGKHQKYNNIWMRSSWETAYAKYLDRQKIKWLYELRTFELKSIERTYTPDFYLIASNKYIEIKGYWRDDAKKKFKAFKKDYSQIKIDLLMKPQLQELGVL